MEQQIRYTSAPDGTRIAYSTMGSGPPVLHIVGWPFSHLREELSISMLRRCYETMADAATLIRLNFRGSGMSQRAGFDYGRGEGIGEGNGMLSDVIAVLDALKVDDAYVIGYAIGGAFAATLAAEYPERVRRLVLWNTSPYSIDDAAGSQTRAASTLLQQDWELYTQTLASMLFGWGSSDEASKMAKVLRSCIDPDEFRAVNVAGALTTGGPTYSREEQQALMRSIAVPTLVLRNETVAEPTQEVAEELTALIPDASLIVLDGPWIVTDELAEAAAHTVLEFFGLRPGQMAPTPHGTVTTVLFTDLVGHTEMMQRLGDERGRDVLREHERITRDLLKQHGGAEVKTMGDAFMASFASVTRAIDCAIALQRAFATHTESMPEPLHVRVGLNAGEPIEEDGDLFGSTVIMASRIAAQAGAGEILIPETLRHLLSGKSYVYADRGETMLKGFEDAVRLYEVRWRD